jgi:hypothetical protein
MRQRIPAYPLFSPQSLIAEGSANLGIEVAFPDGKDLVRRYVESKGGTGDNSEARWREFALLLSSPRLPSDLAVK